MLNRIFKNNYLNLLFFFGLIFLDQTSKFLVVRFDLLKTVQNHGWIGGGFADLLVTVRIGVLIGYYFGLCVLILSFWKSISRSRKTLRVAFVTFFAGITGNLLDRMFFGYVVDFIPLNFGISRATLNIADIFQWIAVLIFLVETLKNGLWKEDDRRTNIFVNQRLQLRLFFKISLVFVGFISSILVLMAAIFSGSTDAATHSHLLPSLILVITSYGFLFETILFSVLLTEVHRWIGPFHAFISYFKSLENRVAPPEFRLRDNDEFKELEIVAKRLRLGK